MARPRFNKAYSEMCTNEIMLWVKMDPVSATSAAGAPGAVQGLSLTYTTRLPGDMPRDEIWCFVLAG